MKKDILLRLFLALACFTQAQNSFATHLFGGELLYTFINGNSYRVVLTMYGDCSGENFPKLLDATPEVAIFDGLQYRQTINLKSTPESNTEVSPVCPDEINNTNCKGGQLPGVTKFVYADTIILPYPSATWRFIFSGVMGNTSFAGRSNSITNIVNSTAMYLEAKLNNVNAPNNSPQYTTIPTPFYCINIQQQYNQGAGDADNDSLVFSLVPALDEDGNQVPYMSPFYAAQPMATSNFGFNTLNGQMTFLPNVLQKSVVVNLVEEYRNGVLVGSSMREMTIIILDNCNNIPPSTKELTRDDVAGGLYIGNNVINICDGIPSVSFNLPITDLNGDKIKVIVANLPPGASANINNNNTTNPYVDFKWNISGVQPGTYNMYMNLTDDNCPLSSNQTIAYTIQILKPAEVGYQVLNPTRCMYDQHTLLTILRGTTPRYVTISRDGAAIKTYFDTTGRITDHFKPGHYQVAISSPNLLCNTSFEFDVVDSGAYPFSPAFKDPHYCPYDTIRPLEVMAGRYGEIQWYDMDGNVIDKEPSFSTATPGVYSWLVSEVYKKCESLKDTFTIYVHEQPQAQILNKTPRICLGDEIMLIGSDGLKYTWYPKEKVWNDRDGNFFTRVTESTPYYAVAVNEFGCKDTTSITFRDIENCCTFSYPTAFTPNNDGKNDGFKPVLYGNQERYEIRIFNRWGQMIFHSENPEEYWHGSFGGKTCDIGTYYYMVRAKCMTGHVEEYKGEVMLIR